MTATQDLPLSGYVLLKVYALQHELRHKDPDEDKDQHGIVNFAWDWKLVDGDVFEVLLQISLEPTPDRDDFVLTQTVGRFQMRGDAEIPLPDFARLQAVAILMPYARQHLSMITSTSFNGTFYLPSVNVVSLMRAFDSSKATGAKQLEQRRTPIAAAKEGSSIASVASPRRRSPKGGIRKKR